MRAFGSTYKCFARYLNFKLQSHSITAMEEKQKSLSIKMYATTDRHSAISSILLNYV